MDSPLSGGGGCHAIDRTWDSPYSAHQRFQGASTAQHCMGESSMRIDSIGLLRAAFAGVLLAAFALGAKSVLADDYPTKPIRLIIPFVAGGGADIVSRVFTQRMTETWGKTIVIDNRPGAGGIVTFQIVAGAAPDGYTLGVMSASQAISPSLYAKLPYDMIKSFTPVVLMTRHPLILVASLSFPPNTIKELIAYAKARPNQISFASSGTNGTSHLTMELFKKMAGVEMTHVPYKGGVPPDLISGQVQLYATNILPTTPLVKAGRIKALAMTSLERTPIMPDLPTIAESGLPGFEANSWFGILGPAKMTKEVVHKLNREIARIGQTAEVRERLLGLGEEPAGSNAPEEFGRMIQSEIKKWADVIKAAGIKTGAALP